MSPTSLLTSIVVVLACSLVAACSPQEKYPESYGLFAWNGKDWIEIGKAKSIISTELPSNTRFLIHGKSIDQLSRSFSVYRQFFIRNSIGQDRDGKNRLIEKKVNEWDSKENPENIDARLSPVKDHPEMVIWTPKTNFPEGVYMPKITGLAQDSFFVGKASVLIDLEQTDSCVDRVLTRKYMWEDAIPAQYVACAGEPTEQLARIVSKAAKNAVFKETPKTDIDLSKIEKLISRGANVNAIVNHGDFGSGEPVLANAIYTGRTDLVKLLLDKGANVNIQLSVGGDSNEFETPLFRATGKLEVFKLLLDRGANPNSKGRLNQTLLFEAATPELVELLLSKGIDINAKNTFGKTALATAEETREYLLKDIERYRTNLADKSKDPGRSQENLAFSLESLKNREKAIEALRKHGAAM